MEVAPVTSDAKAQMSRGYSDVLCHISPLGSLSPLLQLLWREMKRYLHADTLGEALLVLEELFLTAVASRSPCRVSVPA